MRFRLTLAVEPNSSIFIGKSGGVRSADKSFEVDWQGRPFISATSLRGRIRAQLESLAKAIGLRVCKPPRPEQMCKADFADPNCIQQACIACRIFGNPWLPSSISVSDLRLVPVRASDEHIEAPPMRPLRRTLQHPLISDDYMEPPPSTIRTYVSISRQAGTAAEERLFSIEVPGRKAGNEPLRYVGSVSGNLTEAQLGFLLVAAASLNRIGGGKGRGLGAMRLAFDEITLNGDTLVGEDAGMKISDLMRLALEGGISNE